jgi:putative FmdB family regulatory protein
MRAQPQYRGVSSAGESTGLPETVERVAPDADLKEGVMPTYEYVCSKCGRRFVLTEHVKEHAASHKCPKCGSRKVEHRMAEFFAKTSRKS